MRGVLLWAALLVLLAVTIAVMALSLGLALEMSNGGLGGMNGGRPR